MSNPAEEEFFAVEGRPVDYEPAIAELEAKKTSIEEAISVLRELQARGGQRKAPQRAEGISA